MLMRQAHQAGRPDQSGATHWDGAFRDLPSFPLQQPSEITSGVVNSTTWLCHDRGGMIAGTACQHVHVVWNERSHCRAKGAHGQRVLSDTQAGV